MRPAPLSARLLLVAHGSGHPGYADVIGSIAQRVASSRPRLAIALGYLDHCEPKLAEVTEPGDVVVPMLLSRGFHVSTDILEQAPDSIVANPLGPSELLTLACADRLREAGWSGERTVLAAAGTGDPSGITDVELAARLLAAELQTEVTPAYLSTASPSLAELLPAAAVCTYLLAPGHFASQVADCGAPIISAVIGDHPAVARLILDRYDAAVTSGAPASSA